MLRRLPRYLGDEFPSQTEGELVFPDRVDLRGGDTVVFSDGTIATVNGVSLIQDAGSRVLLGEDPTCGPRPHSGRRRPTLDKDGQPIDYGDEGETAEEEG